ncbi:MAG: hydroxyphenylacetyl-CoA thioesterase PaaI [Pseudomonadales bacterium]|nr:hydroxyphenylacetyl-CoA thioesterase PaaI [Pseudomonadales bacterium]
MSDCDSGLETPQQIAERVRDLMWVNDRASQSLGIEVLRVAPGEAVLRMRVREDMLNGHGTCHGGLIAAFADSAFGFACNTYDELTVASGFGIDLLAPAQLGDELTATAKELSRARRTGVYDVDVRNQDGTRIAAFRGRSHTLPGKRITHVG